ncbi:MAG: peptidase [Chitinophaga sp.]|jgi:signal recognition particle subunit SEC65|nr:peptidase [Chitinophaga sp.]
MKWVNINAYQVGLVFKNGVYQRMLQEGNYWLWNEQVTIYHLNQPFNPYIELNVLLKDAKLANALQVIEVSDNEIALQYENGLLKNVLTAGRYAFWKGMINYSFIKADISKIDIDANIERSVLITRLVIGYVRSYSVENYENALLFIDGKFNKVLGPGIYYWWKNNIAVVVAKADMRQQQLEINGQEILTKDKAGLRINAFAQYQIASIEKAIRENKEYDKQLYVAFQLALREYVAGYTLDELLDKKEAIAPFVLEQVKAKAEQLGIEVKGFGIRDIILPGDVKDIMNQVLVAEKKAQANTIMRREETASTRSLLNTAKLMEENAMLWKLKEMEYVEKIADKISNISVNGNGDLIGQLKQIFVPQQ